MVKIVLAGPNLILKNNYYLIKYDYIKDTFRFYRGEEGKAVEDSGKKRINFQIKKNEHTVQCMGTKEQLQDLLKNVPNERQLPE